MNVACIQLEYHDRQTREYMMDHVAKLLDGCAGSDLVLLPELWPTGFMNYDRYYPESEPLDGPTASLLAEKAVRLKAWIHGGSFVEKRDGKYYNTSVLFDRQGDLVAVYRKIHLYTYQCREPELLTPGNELAVAETEFGKIGLATCYDLRFPELFRKLTDLGAEIFLVPACWSYPKDDDWDLFNRARALENTAYLISCGACGMQAGRPHTGRSKIVDPWGTVVANTAHRETIVTANIDPGLVRRVREEYPVLKDRVFV